MLQAQIRIHPLQSAILILKLFQPFNIRGRHAPVLRLPVVVGRIRYPLLTANVLGLTTSFNLVQYLDDLAFCIAGLLH